MKPSSAKAKGRRLQNEVAAAFLRLSPDLRPGDVRPAIMGESGTDIKLSPLAERLIPFDTECKYQERLNIWAALAQTTANARPGRTPLLVFRRNWSETYATLPLDDLLGLL
jgi:ABC-type phosphonate transport system ATPase subunit